MIVAIRQRMGFPTTKILGKPHHKGRAAKVERYVQTVRNQGAALICHVEDAIGYPLSIDSTVTKHYSQHHTKHSLGKSMTV